ncbi:2,3-diphosphoglycerate-dependent phosphoglycerate mutase [Candidatus Ishikawella capsulata]|uniref:2,3-bisphosphoglycerate-dependent phosphoglycerate mutase n=1 Tax=Candidatus Ishikawaella capsulata Mpkobe TaxID=476281 RepID=C5WDC6_9ENTR|nr:2,3-diphosphoglycerate-dependent phosphoglycerate mutase [Candidatus Ishikawaella capsulata]BAH83332.1 phosphoglyceromutase [Candidatus Ishikawaella capsulata Mpkobe]
MSSVTRVVFLRHGQSKWNYENRFTGWCDVDLSKKGCEEAKQAGMLIQKQGFIFDYAYTSLLKRAIHTLWYVLDKIDQAWLPVEKTWHLNERHYGALQGLNKTEVAKKYGDQQVKEWRRSFDSMPPPLHGINQQFSGYDIRYTKFTLEQFPKSESLALTINRVIPFWNNIILPKIKNKKTILIVAHGNSIRALMKYLDGLNNEEILELNIPTGMPLIYEFNEVVKPVRHYYLNNIV